MAAVVVNVRMCGPIRRLKKNGPDVLPQLSPTPIVHLGEIAYKRSLDAIRLFRCRFDAEIPRTTHHLQPDILRAQKKRSLNRCWSMKIGIVGGPNSGKTTIFNALTRSKAATAGFSSGRVEIHTAVVDVPDSRLDNLSEIFAPRPAVYAQVTFNDVAGLTEGIGKEGSIQGSLLNAIAVNDALLLVARSFTNPAVPHPRDRVDPIADFDEMETEFLLNDMVTIENRLERIAVQRSRARLEERQRMAREEVLLERLYPELEKGTPLRMAVVSAEEEGMLAGFGFLSLLPLLRVVNAGDDDDESQYEHLLNRETFFCAAALRLTLP